MKKAERWRERVPKALLTAKYLPLTLTTLVGKLLLMAINRKNGEQGFKKTAILLPDKRK